MKKTRFISLALALLMVMSSFSIVFAGTNIDVQSSTKVTANSDELVSIIVEVEGNALFDYKESNSMEIDSFLESDTATNLRKTIMETQSIVKDRIETTTENKVEFGYVYTTLLNGFAAKVKAADLDEIRNLPGVKAVYLDQIYQRPTPQMITADSIVFADKMQKLGYKGEGMLVSIIDGAVDYEHEIFKLSKDLAATALSEDPVDEWDTTPRVKLTRKGLIEKFNDAKKYSELNFNAYNMMAKEYMTDEWSFRRAFRNEKVPFAFNYREEKLDTSKDYHGTHVAGIIAANGTAATEQYNLALEQAAQVFNGIAPEAQIMSMQVFDSWGSSSTVAILAAIEDSVFLGADVINMSLGSPAGFTLYNENTLAYREYEYDKIIKKANEKGIFVAIAAGNENRMGEGEYGLNGDPSLPLVQNPDAGVVASPAVKQTATAVASLENMEYDTPYFKVNGIEYEYTDVTVQYIRGKFSFVETFLGENENKRTVEFIDCKYGTPEDFTSEVRGKIALIQRGGGVAFVQKVNNASENGAMGCIIYNNNEKEPDERIEMVLDGLAEGTTMSAISVSYNTGKALLELAKNQGENKIEFAKEYRRYPVDEDTKIMSGFSSWGTTGDLKIKPEITAPGGNIYSTYPRQISIGRTLYGPMSGTSMASPAVAGGAAVVTQYVKSTQIGWDGWKYPGFEDFAPEGRGRNNNSEKKNLAETVEKIMMSTATIVKNGEMKGDVKTPYSPRLQGAGLMNLEAATKAKAYLENEDTGKAKVELGEIKRNTFEITFDVVNYTLDNVTYALNGYVITDGYNDINILREAKYIDGAVMKYNDVKMPINQDKLTGENTIEVPGGQTKQVTVTVEIPQEKLDEIGKTMVNGFFIEGFVELRDVNTQEPSSRLSLPYMGFYGKWDKAPVVDGNSVYVKEGSEEAKSVFYNNPNAYAYSVSMNSGMGGGMPVKLGFHKYNKGEELIEVGSKDYISFSPNGDGIQETMGRVVDFLRNVRDLNVYIENSEGKKIRTVYNRQYDYWFKSYVRGGINSSELDVWDGKDDDGNLVPDGQYQYVIAATIDYKGAKPSIDKMPVFVDTEEPLVTGWYDKDTKTVKVEASDNFKMMFVELRDKRSYDRIDKTEWTEPKQSATFEFNINDYKGDVMQLFTVDLAGNESVVDINLSEVPVYTVRFNMNGHGNIVELQRIKKDGLVTKPNVANVDGWKFGGWFKERECKTPWDFENNTITANTTIFAKWTQTSSSPSNPGTPVNPGRPVNPNPGTPVNPGNPGRPDPGVTPLPTPIADEDVPGGQAPAVAQFVDLASDAWYYGDVKAMLEKGIMKGVSANEFAPNKATNRAMIATILHRLDGEETVDFQSIFSDVLLADWFAGSVSWASLKEVVKGYEDGTFRPLRDITREQIATMLYRYVQAKGLGFKDGETSNMKFNDTQEISDYAKDAVAWLNANGIINGKDNGNFDPKANATRAQVSAMINRLLSLLESAN